MREEGKLKAYKVIWEQIRKKAAAGEESQNTVSCCSRVVVLCISSQFQVYRAAKVILYFFFDTEKI